MRLLLATWLVLAVAGCQCLQPVSEGTPDGSAGGSGGGSVGGGGGSLGGGGGSLGGGGGSLGGGAGGGQGGGGVECARAADCTPQVAGVPFCSNTPSSSCIAGRCVTECVGGRTCGHVENNPYCLVCTEPTTQTRCAPSTCSAIFSCMVTVMGSTCARGPVDGTRYRAERQPDCSWSVVADGGEVGHWYDLTPGESFGVFAGVDGLCVGQDLFTGVPRIQWSCPDGCVFVAEGCD